MILSFLDNHWQIKKFFPLNHIFFPFYYFPLINWCCLFSANLTIPFWNLVFGTWYLEFGIWNLEFGAWNLEFGIWYLEFGIWNLEFGTWNLVLGIWCLTSKFIQIS